ncbi:hypothetical protein QBC37DRAFT_272716 [Rhypophila decipiens]|uniref:DUF676 domain-containing protein n=1 Tax=Rhypophila decipiens TaxID=261697 RepID=A0AAN6YJ12_9PEZI|nr:hypothetical protein QBC37DRAFT_272716 [Rhypophila decipiens]
MPHDVAHSCVENQPWSSSDGLDRQLLPNTLYPHRAWKSNDPRTSSTQSLAPSLASQEQRRTLLVIYIHGFMGNDSSFRSFPAHMHQFLKEALAETHVIHTKIYPRYKTYKSIQVARDNFSLWLEPHESPTTDVVLVGHSMGGLLAAEVALQPRQNGALGSSRFRHRILGTISLDAPLLGLHPGIVVSGIASLFRPAATPPVQVDNSNDGSQQSLPPISPDPSIYSEIAPPSGASSPAPTQPSSSSSSSYFQLQNRPDPYFNPTFFNDSSFVDRGWFRNIAHFANKHRQENLVGAAANHIMSHLEFGGCLADYPGMIARYNRVRALEDVDDLAIRANGGRDVRVRFVNYYTVSTGLLKKKKETEETDSKSVPPAALLKPPGPSGQATSARSSMDLTLSPPGSVATSGTGTPRISIEAYSDNGRHMILEEIEPIPEMDDLTFEDPTPGALRNPTKNSDDDNPTVPVSNPGIKPEPSEPPPPPPSEESHANTDEPQLPPIPDLPPPLEAPDLTKYPDKESRKQAEKEYKANQKAFNKAVKNRDKVIKERDKIMEKHRLKKVKEAEKIAKLAEKEAKVAEKKRLAEEKEASRAEEALVEGNNDDINRSGEHKEKEKGKNVKLRKFCMLPSKVPGAINGKNRKAGGEDDPTWVQVYMEGVDEVGAHCGLFFPGPHYERLVGDVGMRIVGWVEEDISRRIILESSEDVD